MRAAAEGYLGDEAEADGLSPAVLQRLAWRQARSGATCSACGLEKPLGAFARDPRRSTGLDSRCRACEAARVRAYRNPGPLLL